MRKSSVLLLFKLVSLLCVIALGMPSAALAQPQNLPSAATVYQPTWASVDQHNPAPEWFKDAKFGIYFHWGVFSVPAYGSEWYPRNMYNRSGNSGEYQHQLSVFGDPFGNWPYHNFINGANNKSGQFTQFAPKLTSAGGAWDPNAWAQLFVDSGAKFAGPVAEHHDGFSMWDSTVNEWNAVDKGPRLDLVGQLATAIKGKGLKFLVSSHNAYNFTGFYQWVPSQSDASLKKLYGQLPATQEYQLWVDKLKELGDQYQPDIIWHDFNLGSIPESYRLQFLSYYFNKGVDWNKEVVSVYKDGFNQNGSVLDYERGGPGGLTSYYWLTDDAISSSTWSYTTGMQYYASTALLHSLIDRVSKNGNLLLNISPMADGSIPQQQKDILIAMGNWLKRNGEAIYSTRAWTTYGEGPTQMGGGTGFQAPKAGTNTDFRFTRSTDNRILYATVLGWPGNGVQMRITSLASGKINLSTLTGVQLITNPGSYTNLSYTQNSSGLNVTMPATQPYSAPAYSFRLTFSGQIPANVVFYQDTNYGGTAVALSPGTYTTAQLAAAGVPNNWASSVAVPAGYTVEIYDQDNLGGTRWAFTSSNPDFIAAGLNDMMSSVRITSSASNPTPTRTPTPGGPTATPTRTPTPGGPTATPTRTPTPGGTFPVAGTYYRLINRNSGKVAEVAGFSTADGGNVQQWTWTGTTSQQWSFVSVGGGYYNVINRGSGKCLDVNGVSTADGANVQQWTCGTGTNQRWSLTSLTGGYYRLTAQHSGKVLDVVGNGTADGVNIDQWTSNNGNNQQWQIVP